VRSEEGKSLRASMMKNVLSLRSALEGLGLEVVGNPSAIVSAKVGDEALARMVSKRLPGLGVVANLVEFPAVAKGSARFRLQVMAKHSQSDIDHLVERLRTALQEVKPDYSSYRDFIKVAQPQPEQERRIA
jgi:7-keto-8-aminopelargonate synthetase-like enzyme